LTRTTRILHSSRRCERVDDGVPGALLDQRRAGVLQVQEHLIRGRLWAFSRKRGLLPGTARQERRGCRRLVAVMGWSLR